MNFCSLEENEKKYILKVFSEVNYSPLALSKALKISRATVYRKLHAYGVDFTNKVAVIVSTQNLLSAG